jgi:hypothetical protein
MQRNEIKAKQKSAAATTDGSDGQLGVRPAALALPQSAPLSLPLLGHCSASQPFGPPLNPRALSSQMVLQCLQTENPAHKLLTQLEDQYRTKPELPANTRTAELFESVPECSPITKEDLDDQWKLHLMHKLSWQDATDKFDQGSQAFQGLPVDKQAEAFPDTIDYKRGCGVLCKKHPSAELHTSLRRALTNTVKHHGSPKQASQESILHRLIITSNKSQTSRIYAWLVAPHAASGKHEASQVLTFTKQLAGSIPASEDSDQGLKLQLDYDDIASPSDEVHALLKHPMVGPCRKMLSDDFAKYVVDFPFDDDGLTSTVTICKLDFDDIDLETVVVSGLHSDFPPVVCDCNSRRTSSAKSHPRPGNDLMSEWDAISADDCLPQKSKSSSSKPSSSSSDRAKSSKSSSERTLTDVADMLGTDMFGSLALLPEDLGSILFSL